MSSCFALLLVVTMVAYTEVCVKAQDQRSDIALSSPPTVFPERPEDIPDDVPWPPPIDKLPPLPSPLPNVPSDAQVPKEPPLECGPTQHWSPPGECVDGAPETGPTAIAGIEIDKAEDIFEQNHWWLMSIPGVTGVALTAGGIRVEIQTTDGVGLIPKEIEGLPVFTVPYMERHYLSHTIINRLLVEHAGALVIDKAENGATLGAAVLSHGETWWTLPTHLLRFNNLCGNSLRPPFVPSGLLCGNAIGTLGLNSFISRLLLAPSQPIL